ncbi:hypothetical protein THAOC_25428, partial [Thalassiosira oceanica]
MRALPLPLLSRVKVHGCASSISRSSSITLRLYSARFFLVSFILAPRTRQWSAPSSSRPDWATPGVSSSSSCPVRQAAASSSRGEVAERSQLDGRAQGSFVVVGIAVDPPPEFDEGGDEFTGVLAAE